jgi:hypothetical protein
VTVTLTLASGTIEGPAQMTFAVPAGWTLSELSGPDGDVCDSAAGTCQVQLPPAGGATHVYTAVVTSDSPEAGAVFTASYHDQNPADDASHQYPLD